MVWDYLYKYTTDEGSIEICRGKSMLTKVYETKTNILPHLSASNGNTQTLICFSNLQNENTLKDLVLNIILKCKLNK